jgi:hypothetical protein
LPSHSRRVANFSAGVGVGMGTVLVSINDSTGQVGMTLAGVFRDGGAGAGLGRGWNGGCGQDRVGWASAHHRQPIDDALPKA